MQVDSTASGAPGQEGGSRALGTIAKNASGGVEPPEYSGRVRRYVLQAGARELMPVERVAYCLRRAHGRRVDVLHVPATRSACYRGLMTCGSVWMCPVCAAKISERRRLELGQAIASWRAQGGRVLLVTYTVRHRDVDSLSHLLEGLLQARRATRSGRGAGAFAARYGLAGSVRGLEVTHGVNGWHPHIHELLFVRGDVDAAALELDLRATWAAMVAAVGLRAVNAHGLVVQDTDQAVADYVAKFGRDPAWGPEHELAKQVVKSGRASSRSPADLLAAYTFAGDVGAGRLWLEYARTFKGRRQLHWSRGLRGLLGLGGGEQGKSDEEIADEHDQDAVLLASLTLVQWRVILANDARAEVLDVASLGDREKLWEFLSVLGVYGPGSSPAIIARAQARRLAPAPPG